MKREREILDRWGMTPIINAIGHATPLGNGRLDESVIDAMRDASRVFMSIARLQQLASLHLAEITHAEAGYAVSGAASGLTLATAACIAGLDPMRMNRLPDTSPDTPSTVVIHRIHRYDYDHAVRQAGAKLREVGFPNLTFPYELEAAILPDTAAVLFRGDGPRNVVPFQDVVSIAHARNVPVIVDAALSVPPVENLWSFIDGGADLVVFSGGKAIGGPPASGFVVGQRKLLASVALQHQDMDIRLETWPKTEITLNADQVSNPPYQGIGRPMKVGKEQIVGLLVALDRYLARDHRAELDMWSEQVDRIHDAISSRLPNLEMVVEVGGEDSDVYVPQLKLNLGSRGRAGRVSKALSERDPAIFCHESALWEGKLIVVPSCIRIYEEEPLVEALTAEITCLSD